MQELRSELRAVVASLAALQEVKEARACKRRRGRRRRRGASSSPEAEYNLQGEWQQFYVGEATDVACQTKELEAASTAAAETQTDQSVEVVACQTLGGTVTTETQTVQSVEAVACQTEDSKEETAEDASQIDDWLPAESEEEEPGEPVEPTTSEAPG